MCLSAWVEDNNAYVYVLKVVTFEFRWRRGEHDFYLFHSIHLCNRNSNQKLCLLLPRLIPFASLLWTFATWKNRSWIYSKNEWLDCLIASALTAKRQYDDLTKIYIHTHTFTYTKINRKSIEVSNQQMGHALSLEYIN